MVECDSVSEMICYIIMYQGGAMGSRSCFRVRRWEGVLYAGDCIGRQVGKTPDRLRVCHIGIYDLPLMYGIVGILLYANTS